MNREAIKARVIGFIGALALGLGVFALIDDTPGTLHPWLAVADVAWGLALGGLLLLAIEWMIIWPILKRRMLRRDR